MRDLPSTKLSRKKAHKSSIRRRHLTGQKGDQAVIPIRLLLSDDLSLLYARQHQKMGEHLLPAHMISLDVILILSATEEVKHPLFIDAAHIMTGKRSACPFDSKRRIDVDFFVPDDDRDPRKRPSHCTRMGQDILPFDIAHIA